MLETLILDYDAHKRKLQTAGKSEVERRAKLSEKIEKEQQQIDETNAFLFGAFTELEASKGSILHSESAGLIRVVSILFSEASNSLATCLTNYTDVDDAVNAIDEFLAASFVSAEKGYITNPVVLEKKSVSPSVARPPPPKPASSTNTAKPPSTPPPRPPPPRPVEVSLTPTTLRKKSTAAAVVEKLTSPKKSNSAEESHPNPNSPPPRPKPPAKSGSKEDIDGNEEGKKNFFVFTYIYI